MGFYSEENITIRRKDGNPVTHEDLTGFDQFFHSDTFEEIWKEVYCEPHICFNGMEIYAGFMTSCALDGNEIIPFAKANPHLQIELIESSESEEIGKTRFLYEGELYEELHEIRYFEEPKMIDWKEGT